MKVLHVIPSIDTESGGPVKALIGFINATGVAFSTSVATTDLRLTHKQLQHFRQQARVSGHIHIFRHLGRHSYNISPGLLLWLRRNVKQYDILHIHALFHPVSSFAARLARKRNIPYVLRPLGTLSSYTLHSRNSRLKHWYFQHIDRPLVEGACCLHFTAWSERVNAQALAPHMKCEVIPIPLIGDNQVKTGPLPQATGQKQPRTILFLSRLHPKKGLEILLQAFAQLDTRFADVNLVIAGSGDTAYDQRLRLMARELRCADRVNFAGFVEGAEKAHLLASSSIFVLPSADENFGVAVAEAMAAGLPVVVSPHVGLARDIERYQAGLVVDNEPASLSTSFQHLLEDQDRCTRAGENGRRLVAECYSLGRVGDALAAMYTHCRRTH